MSLTIDNCIKYDFENLTKVPFGNEQNSLNFRFVQAYEADVSEIGSDFSPHSKVTHVVSPDVIRFSPHKELLKKISQIYWDQEPAKQIFSFPAPQLYHIPRSYHSESGYYEIPAKDSQIFFQAIQQIQESNSEICIPTRLFQNVLRSLQDRQHLTSQEREMWETGIKTSLTLTDYQETAFHNKDAKKAISLAHYYSNKSNSSSLVWLSRAQRYLGNENLSDYIDLNSFLQNFDKIEAIEVFDPGAEKLIDSIASCSSFKKLSFDLSTDYNLSNTAMIGNLIKKTTTIKEACFHSFPGSSCRKLNGTTITPIAEALKINQSIELLNFCDTVIADEGVEKLIEAIKSNPNTKVKALNLYGCFMTDKSARKLIDFLRNSKQINRINIRDNSISKSLQEKLQQILAERST